VVVLLSRAWSAKAGSQLNTFLAKHDASMRTQKERDVVAANLNVVFLEQGMSVWVPFGMCHVMLPVSSNRDSKDSKQASKKKAKKGPGIKNANDPEFAQYLWLPCHSSHHVAQDAALVGKVLSNLIAWREWWQDRVAKNADFQKFLKELEEKASKRVLEEEKTVEEEKKGSDTE
jgi:hypothetical protein